MPPMKPPAPVSPGKTLSVGELARRWDLRRRAIERLLADGRLLFEEVQGELRVPLAEVRRWERHSRGAATACSLGRESQD